MSNGPDGNQTEYAMLGRWIIDIGNQKPFFDDQEPICLSFSDTPWTSTFRRVVQTLDGFHDGSLSRGGIAPFEGCNVG
jgi:hypothetical protein